MRCRAGSKSRPVDAGGGGKSRPSPRLDRRSGQVGDIIVAVNGKAVDTLSTFVAELDRVGIGNTASLTVRRANSERRVPVKVIDVPRQAD